MTYTRNMYVTELVRYNESVTVIQMRFIVTKYSILLQILGHNYEIQNICTNSGLLL